MITELSSYYTRLPTDLNNWLQEYHSIDSRRRYHNWHHVDRLYTWAHTWGFDYDLALDIAIGFHDAVYDERPNKEVRSADLMRDSIRAFMPYLSQSVIDKAYSLIGTTIDHVPTDDNRLVLCDLADLGVEFYRNINSENILSESILLYPNVKRVDILRNNIIFMRGLRNRLEDNDNLWSEDYEKFQVIVEGIGLSIRSLGSKYAQACK